MVNTENKNKTNTGGIAAGIAIGAALGAAAVALKDKKNQSKVKNTVKKVKDWADRTSGQVAERSENIITESQKDLESIKKEIKDPKN